MVCQRGNVPSFNLPLETVGLSLQDLIAYFQTPGEGLGPEAKQKSVRALKNSGGGHQVWSLTALTIYTSTARQLILLSCWEKAADEWENILNYFYELPVLLVLTLACFWTLYPPA
ncbi:ryanodine receptor 2-like isoform X1 [Salvelinus alpinus]|uniref:ryanodine receptor 2-like isoform X1 n=1 Tax=Salvelinus alpinus TaxID=8036 RepID=UPI0039FD0CF0